MNNIFRDPIWEFVGVIVAVLGTIAAIFITIWLTHRRKILSYRVLSHTPIASVHNSRETDGRVQILFNGEPVHNVELILLKIENTGDIPIASDDYENPLQISLNKTAKILEAQIIEKSPNNLPASIDYEESTVSLKPLLLNSKDSVTMKILASQFNGSLFVEGRIIGVKSVKEIKHDTPWYLWRVGIACYAGGAMIGAIGIFIGEELSAEQLGWAVGIFGGVACVVGFFMMRVAAEYR